MLARELFLYLRSRDSRVRVSNALIAIPLQSPHTLASWENFVKLNKRSGSAGTACRAVVATAAVCDAVLEACRRLITVPPGPAYWSGGRGAS